MIGSDVYEQRIIDGPTVELAREYAVTHIISIFGEPR